MSDFTIEQLEHFKKVMEPTPPFLEALIAEKRKHDDLRQEIGSLIGKLETRADNAAINHAYRSAVAFRETAQALDRFLEATDG